MIEFDKFIGDAVISVSGWRAVFARSGDEEDPSGEISDAGKAFSYLAAKAFFEFLRKKGGWNKKIILACDTRPTGDEICRCIGVCAEDEGVSTVFLGETCTPEVLATAQGECPFAHVTASHNPIGHNGIKFGLSDGAVLSAENAAELLEIFRSLCSEKEVSAALKRIAECGRSVSLTPYEKVLRKAIWDCDRTEDVKVREDALRSFCKSRKVCIVCDFNGSARAKSIDSRLLKGMGIKFVPMNGEKFAHGIIPEGKNLEPCAKKVEEEAKQGGIVLGYVPDCDGDRGNIVFFDEKESKAKILEAQEVFALCVMSELSFAKKQGENARLAVATNDATSMRCEKIAENFGAKAFRAEVGEANVVGLAEKLRNEGWKVRIAGEGSNGGNITHPQKVRDPLCTIFSILRLLADENATLSALSARLPQFVTTGVSEERAKMQIKAQSQEALKKAFQKEFLQRWEGGRKFFDALGIKDWMAFGCVGQKEFDCSDDFSLSKTGGLKLAFFDENGEKIAFLWMRGSKTEKVFRVMCDVKGKNIAAHDALLAFLREILAKSDAKC